MSPPGHGHFGQSSNKSGATTDKSRHGNECFVSIVEGPMYYTRPDLEVARGADKFLREGW